jgi:hypothetical protein
VAEPQVFVWARNVGAVVGLIAFAGTVVGWIAKESFRHGFLAVFPWAGVLCLLAALGLVVWVAKAWFRLGRALGKGNTRFDDRPFTGDFKDMTWFFVLGIFRTTSGRVITALAALGIAGLAIDIWAFQNDRELPPILIACAAVSVALVGLAAAVEDQYEKQKKRHKTCPDCAESVKDAANVCRFCGHRFGPAPPPYEPSDR